MSCGTISAIADPLATYQQDPNLAGSYSLRIYIHVIRKSNHQDGLTSAEIENAKITLNRDFNQHGIFFSLACINYIDNDNLYYGSALPNAISASSPHSRNDGINIYLIPFAAFPYAVSGTNLGLAGGIGSTNAFYTFFKSDDKTISHEMGHVLGLFHTFHGSCNESVLPDLPEFTGPTPTTNCLTRGDFVCDTEADDRSYLPLPTNISLCGDAPDDCTPPTPSTATYNSNPFNIMSYGGRCQSYFTPGQISRIKNTIEARKTSTFLNILDVNTTITENTVWNGQVDLKSNVVVLAPFSLTINGTVKMAPGRSIIVEGGNSSLAKTNALLVVNGVVTLNTAPGINNCNDLLDDKLWGGIALMDGKGTSSGGVLTCGSTSLIEKAFQAVSYYEDQYTGNPGRMVTSGGVFKNNYKSISFAKSSFKVGPVSGVSLVTNTEFIKDNSYDADSGFGDHINMIYSGRVNFSNINTSDSKQTGLNVVNCHSSPLKIQSNSKLKDAVTAGVSCGDFLSTSSEIKLLKTTFSNSYLGVDAKAASNLFIEGRNEFNSSFADIKVDKSNALYIRANTFTNPESTNIQLSGQSNNIEIISNNKLKNANTSNNKFGVSVFGNHPTLALSCNVHEKINAADIGIIDYFLGNTTFVPRQGRSDAPTGISFSKSTGGYDIFNLNGMNKFQYYYYAQNVNETPTNTQNTENISSLFDANCGFVPAVTVEEAEIKYVQTHNTLLTQRSTLNALVDAGNTTGVLQLIHSSTNGASLKSQLLLIAPYLSDQAIIAMFDRSDILSNTDKIQILSANNDALSHFEVYDYIVNSIHTFSLTEWASILRNATARTNLDISIASLSLEEQSIISEAVSLLVDNDNVNYNAVIQWEGRRNTLEGHLAVAAVLSESGNLSGYLNYLNSIPSLIPLNASSTQELNLYINYQTLLVTAHNQGRYFKDLTPAEISTLSLYATSSDNKVSQWIKNFLEYYYGIIFSNNSQKTTTSNEKVAEHKEFRDEPRVHIMPNPANEYIRFEMDKTAIGHNSVVVTNEIGKVVWSERFHGNLNDYQIDISTFSSGVYFYQVIDALGSASGKFVVIH